MSKEHNLLTLAEILNSKLENTTSKLTMSKEHKLLTLTEKLNSELKTPLQSLP